MKYLTKKTESLRKLLPSVHLLTQLNLTEKKGNMVNKIQLLKSGFFKDVVKTRYYLILVLTI